MLFGVLFFHIFNLETPLKHHRIQLNWNSTVYFQILVTSIISNQVVHAFFSLKLLRNHPKVFSTDSSLTSFFIHTFTQKLHSNIVTWKTIRTLYFQYFSFFSPLGLGVRGRIKVKRLRFSHNSVLGRATVKKICKNKEKLFSLSQFLLRMHNSYIPIKTIVLITLI